MLSHCATSLVCFGERLRSYCSPLVITCVPRYYTPVIGYDIPIAYHYTRIVPHAPSLTLGCASRYHRAHIEGTSPCMVSQRTHNPVGRTPAISLRLCPLIRRPSPPGKAVRVLRLPLIIRLYLFPYHSKHSSIWKGNPSFCGMDTQSHPATEPTIGASAVCRWSASPAPAGHNRLRGWGENGVPMAEKLRALGWRGDHEANPHAHPSSAGTACNQHP